MTILQTVRTDDQLSRPRLRVGLVNNMPDGALAATERQFGEILRAAAPDREVELVLFQIPAINRHDDMRASMASRYRPFEAIADSGVAALVVTGAATSGGPLKDEPYWPSFTRLVDQVAEARLPTVWSCLAAHAAVDHMDGIKRRPLDAKCCGFYDCASVKPDPLLDGIERPWRVPHSRYNQVDEAELEARGYEVLMRSPVGPDVWVRRGPPLFVFFQGHPEYDRSSLAAEYKRDIRAYFHGERPEPPAPPVGAPDPEMEQSLRLMTEAVLANRAEAFIADKGRTAKAEPCPPEWRTLAVRLYRNWLRAVV
jgi:homoserine O-succinyltransferase